MLINSDDFKKDEKLDYVAFTLVFFASIRYGSKEALLEAAYSEAESLVKKIKETEKHNS